MATRNVVIRGDALLQKKSRPVEKFDERLHVLIDDMIETMHKKEGVGIAAPQVGILRRVVIIEPDPETTMALVNPEILESEGSEEGTEGCLCLFWRLGRRCFCSVPFGGACTVCGFLGVRSGGWGMTAGSPSDRVWRKKDPTSLTNSS